MPSSLAARYAVRQGMAPSINPQSTMKPQGWLNQNAGTIEKGAGWAAPVTDFLGQAAGNYAINRAIGVGGNALESQLNGWLNPDASDQAIKRLGGGNFNLDQFNPQNAKPYDTNSQLSDTLKNLMHERIGSLEESHGRTNPERWEQQAYAAANGQSGGQRTPSYEDKPPQFPWEEALTGAVNRYNTPETMGQGSMTSEQNQEGPNPNEGRNALLKFAPTAGLFAGGAAGAAAGSVIPVLGTVYGGISGAYAGYKAGQQARDKFTVAHPKRYT